MEEQTQTTIFSNSNMKAKIIKTSAASLGTKAVWAAVGREFDVVKIVGNPNDPVNVYFFIRVPGVLSQPYTRQVDCLYLGGKGSEWELINDASDPDDAYDRAMGIL